MKLYLAQHGEAFSKKQDHNRPLNKKGVDDVDHIARFLNSSGIQVKKIIHSGKLRAEQTAEHLARHFAPNVELESTGIINPNDSPESFAWQSDSWEDDTLIVGHLPFMARLVSHLVHCEEEHMIVSFQPGSVVCLERVEDNHWLINWMIRPELIQ